MRLLSIPSVRAVETATAIANQLNCKIEVDDGFSELDFGDWSGIPVAQLEEDSRYQRWKEDPWLNAPPRGESLTAMRLRLFQSVSKLTTSMAAAGQPLILVIHFFPLLVLFRILAVGKEVRCDNASISRLLNR